MNHEDIQEWRRRDSESFQRWIHEPDEEIDGCWLVPAMALLLGVCVCAFMFLFIWMD